MILSMFNHLWLCKNTQSDTMGKENKHGSVEIEADCSTWGWRIEGQLIGRILGDAGEGLAAATGVRN